MKKEFEAIAATLFRSGKEEGFSLFDPNEQFYIDAENDSDIAMSLNAAFLILLTGDNHPQLKQAKQFIRKMESLPRWANICNYYNDGLVRIQSELKKVSSTDSEFLNRIKELSEWISKKGITHEKEAIREKMWSVFFPEANGINYQKKKAIKALREKRTVTITNLNKDPISNPVKEVLFTSNVLLTTPDKNAPNNSLPLSGELKKYVKQISKEPQHYWYDHPIQVGVESEKNEALYGLAGLQEMIRFEQKRGNMTLNENITCLLSVSVTHDGLHEIAKQYIEEELAYSKKIKNRS